MAGNVHFCRGIGLDTPQPPRNAQMFACVVFARLDSQLQRAPTKQVTRQSGRSCFDFHHSGCSAALINSNWIELDEDRHESVRPGAHTHTRGETRSSAPVPTRFCPLQPAETEALGVYRTDVTRTLNSKGQL